MTAIVNGSVIVKKKPSGKRVIFASAFGNALEFFDFGVYNFFVVYISTLFFPPSADKNVALLLAFATFGVSFFMRPLGGIIVGAWADRFGRKPAMVFTIAPVSYTHLDRRRTGATGRGVERAAGRCSRQATTNP